MWSTSGVSPATGKIAAMADHFELGCKVLVCHLIVKEKQQGMASHVKSNHWFENLRESFMAKRI